MRLGRLLPPSAARVRSSPSPMTDSGREDRLSRRAVVLAAALPVAAAAGDSSLYVPAGNVVGIFWALVATFVVGAGWRTRSLALASALLAAALPHFAPEAWMEAWPSAWPRAAFLLGLAPPLAAVALVLWVGRARERAP